MGVKKNKSEEGLRASTGLHQRMRLIDDIKLFHSNDLKFEPGLRSKVLSFTCSKLFSKESKRFKAIWSQ